MENKKWQMTSYECQIGMYYSAIKKLKNGLIVYSNIVESTDWNFFAEFSANSVQEFENAFTQAKLEFQKIGRQFCFVLSPWTKVSKSVLEHINNNYDNYTNVSFMLTDSFSIQPNNDSKISYRVVDNKTEADYFVQVFKKSKTQTLPNDVYPALADYFFTALRNSFDIENGINEYGYKFFNYISLYKGKAVGMATACVKDKVAGLYGGGTFIDYREKGIFSGLLNFMQQDLKKQGVQYFFGITEKDSNNESYYNKIGWKTLFSNKYYIPKKN